MRIVKHNQFDESSIEAITKKLIEQTGSNCFHTALAVAVSVCSIDAALEQLPAREYHQFRTYWQLWPWDGVGIDRAAARSQATVANWSGATREGAPPLETVRL